MSSSDPSIDKPSDDNYPLFGEFTGTAGAEETILASDDYQNVGRYVILQIPGTIQSINICELTVYGIHFGMYMVNGREVLPLVIF